MKLIIQIPCFNEESGLPEVLKRLPREVVGFSKLNGWLSMMVARMGRVCLRRSTGSITLSFIKKIMDWPKHFSRE